MQFRLPRYLRRCKQCRRWVDRIEAGPDFLCRVCRPPKPPTRIERISAELYPDMVMFYG